MYVCIVCKQNLFSSDTKYDSGCGWPAFNDVLDKGKVTLHKDTSTGNIWRIIIYLFISFNYMNPNLNEGHMYNIKVVYSTVTLLNIVFVLNWERGPHYVYCEWN